MSCIWSLVHVLDNQNLLWYKYYYIIINNDCITAHYLSSSFLSLCRLQGMVQGVYRERCALRKNMVDLDAAERDILLRIFQKVSQY